MLLSAGFCYAEQNPGRQAQPRNPREGGQPHETNRFVSVVTYPFRTAYTVVRTPILVGETFTGKRTFISKRGLFMVKETPDEMNDTNTRDRDDDRAREMRR